MKDRLLFLEKIEDAVAGYSCDAKDENFEVFVKITCEDGWVYANVVG